MRENIKGSEFCASAPTQFMSRQRAATPTKDRKVILPWGIGAIVNGKELRWAAFTCNKQFIKNSTWAPKEQQQKQQLICDASTKRSRVAKDEDLKGSIHSRIAKAEPIH